jgi:hypothetical protein
MRSIIAPALIAAFFFYTINLLCKKMVMNKRAPYILVVFTIIPFILVSCSNTESGTRTSERGTAEIQQCRAGSARPISVETAIRAIRRSGFGVVAVRDEGICSARDMIAVFDNSEHRSYDSVLNTEGHINCGLREKPIYLDHTEIISSKYGNWNELRYENLECGLEKTGAGSSIDRREKFREIFEQLTRRQRAKSRLTNSRNTVKKPA